MAYLVRRGVDRIEIRESLATSRGPRSRLLASFREPLSPDVLERAAACATRPFDPRALLRRARAAGVATAEHSHEPEARALLARLHRPDPLDPVLVAALRQALGRLPEAFLPEAVADVAEWVGASAAQRGAALRELLDLYGRIAASRPPSPRQRERPRFPRFSSRRKTG
jgi:hypothetical protein